MIKILTCKVGDKIINCYDGVYNKEQLKKWADKNILLCPACGKPYEYCHGKVTIPYFRHKEKEECEDGYSESETEEHLKGKIQLYEWIKKQSGVTDVILEGWIPETKQRPDIMFKYDNKPYVIEYQCSPIATEYYERHELYKLAEIKDIWICGTEKYFGDSKRFNTLEKDFNSVGYFNANDTNFIFNIRSDISISFLSSMKNFKVGYSELISKCSRDRFVVSNIENIKISNNHFTLKGLSNIIEIKNKIFQRGQRNKNSAKNMEDFYENKVDKIFSYIKNSSDDINYIFNEYYVKHNKLRLTISTNSNKEFKYKGISDIYEENITINVNNQSIYKELIKLSNRINNMYSELHNTVDKLDKSLFYFTKINKENKIRIYLKNFENSNRYKKLNITEHNLKYFKESGWNYYHSNDSEFNFISSFINELKFLNKNKYPFNLCIDSCDFKTINNQDINVRNYVTIIGYLYSIGFKNLELYY